MLRSTLRRLSLAMVVLAVSVAGSVGSTGAQAEATAPPWLDTFDRDAVVAAYAAEFNRTEPTHGWTGGRSTCAAGTTSGAFRQSIFSRINYFRSMAGVPAGVTENSTYSAKAQQAALMMAVTGRLSHSPDTSFGCYSSVGREAAGSSNLYYGRTGTGAITGYMEDPGASNARVGHRSWILHPTTRQMGTGDIPSASRSGLSSNALWVFDNVFGTQPTLRESAGFVAWPPRGYVPGEVVFPRWSFSLRGADFSRASVRVSVDGVQVNSPVVHRDAKTNGAPFPLIVWEPQNINRNPATDTVYQVHVDGVVRNGSTQSFRYDVIVLGDQRLAAASTVAPEQYAAFVTTAYRDFIGRAATADELAYWTQQLASGMSRNRFVNILSHSDAWTSSVVERLYVDTLGRRAEPTGRDYWIARLQAGMPVARVAASFYGSDEYVRSQGGTYQAWLTDLYQVLLERRPDGSGLAYWDNRASRIGTGSVAYGFYQSIESRQARVAALYQRFLGRNPDRTGLAHWTNVLASGDDLKLAAFLASSDEYWDRSQ